MGPITLFDKSFLQTLKIDESVWFAQFFTTIICPLFYIETLSDLQKEFEADKIPEEEVRKIADKFPDNNGHFCAYHLELSLHDLLGISIPMRGQIPRDKGRPVEESGIVYERSTEEEAFLRWSKQDFSDKEHQYAKTWRNSLEALDLNTIAAKINNLGVNGKSCNNLDEAKKMALFIVNNVEKNFEVMELAFLLLRIPEKHRRNIWNNWNIHQNKPLNVYAPYAAFVLTMELFFQITLSAKLIPFEVNSYIDMSYLCYLPFCSVFVSTDKLHRKCAPLFMSSNQQFVWGPSLKEDLKALNEYYSQLPINIQEQGISSFASQPPSEIKSLVAEIWDNNFPNWRYKEKQKAETNEKVLEQAQRMMHAQAIPKEKVNFDLYDPNSILVTKLIRRKNGSWYQLPKN